MPEKITIFNATFPPEKGAAPSRMYQLARFLVQQGYDVQVVCFMPNYPTGRIFPGYKGRLFCRETVDGIPVSRIWSLPSNSGNNLLRIISLLSQSLFLLLLALPVLGRRRGGKVIINTPPLSAAYIFGIIARLYRNRILLNVSDLWPLSALELGAIRKGFVYNRLHNLEQKVYRMADAYSGQSAAILEHIARTVPHRKPAFLYYNLQAGAQVPARQAAGQKRRIVYAGLLGIAQGVADICREVDFAAAGTELHIYGDGNERDAILAFIAAHPQAGVYYHGTVAAGEMPAVLGAYDATLIPLKTHIEGALPSKIFMAVAHHLPVIFCGNGEGASIVRTHGIGWVCAPGDHGQLQAVVSGLAQMPAQSLAAMRDRCAGLNSTLFNMEEQQQRFRAFIDSI